jgi:hypothetical protein
MTAPDLQRVITREGIERDAEVRHRRTARYVRRAGGRVAIVHRLHDRSAEIWPTRGAEPVEHEAIAISWVEYALNRGWLSRTGLQERDQDGAIWVACVLTPAGRRFGAELDRADLVGELS